MIMIIDNENIIDIIFMIKFCFYILKGSFKIKNSGKTSKNSWNS